MSDQSQVWFITGSTRGLGRALAEAVLATGHRLVATARRPEQLADLAGQYGPQLRTIRLDVTQPAEADHAIAEALDAFGRLDVVVNNAGYGFTGAFEEIRPEDFRALIDTNFWGVVNVTRAVIPVLRRQGSGHIIQITSIGGRGAVPGLSGYHAAKFAVEGFSESIAQELRPLGVKLTIVEPGGFRTDWAGPSMDFAEPIEAYAGSVGLIRGYMEGHAGQEPGDPRKAAQAVLEIAEAAEPPLRLPLGNDAMAMLRFGVKKTLDELDRWAYLTKSTDFDGLQVSDEYHAVMDLAQA